MIKHFTYYQSTIFYRVEGKGKVVVLLHGFGEDSNIFNHQINFLKHYCQLIVPDLPGSGNSEMLNEENGDITINDYAKCIYALLIQENIQSCIMLGHSMGGYITLSFGEMYPQHLNGFGLIHSTAFPDSEEKKQNRLRGIEMMEEYGGYAFLKTTIPNLFSTNFKKNYPEKLTLLIEEGRKFSTKALQQYYKAMMNRTDKTSVLKNTSLPVLFIIGTEDVAAPMNDVLQQAKLPLSSYIHILENIGHMSMWEATENLNQFLIHFIQAI
ncbi:MAG: alpha/beta hydrolase [Bacteroidetes bacterium]|nr:alpha/beta hydrolase [Bacteroidota bacterium]MBS1648538.1 alpha/beta hydrolase [Bacteroidota bacterium]